MGLLSRTKEPPPVLDIDGADFQEMVIDSERPALADLGAPWCGSNDIRQAMKAKSGSRSGAGACQVGQVCVEGVATISEWAVKALVVVCHEEDCMPVI